VYDLGQNQGLISTTDFFMPIVDDPFTFGEIAAANAVSDIYAMGGKPILAIGILGWPADRVPMEAARDTLEGARALCARAGFPIGGGHSIDNPEPLFGLAVNGLVSLNQLKQNSTAKAGDLLYLTKGLGIGMLTTAEKRGILRSEDQQVAIDLMTRLNDVGISLGAIDGVSAMTDVTGFGFLGHALEVCKGSKVALEVNYAAIPHATDLQFYLEEKCSPGGTSRNFQGFGHHISTLSDEQRAVLFDPQTSGGLLVAVHPSHQSEVEDCLGAAGLEDFAKPLGTFTASSENQPRIIVR
jgi:selenide,water dikinase